MLYFLLRLIRQVLCYIDATGNADLKGLEAAVETFTYFPLNEICAGFFFGGFSITRALEDVFSLQSLYAKTQVNGCMGLKLCLIGAMADFGVAGI